MNETSVNEELRASDTWFVAVGHIYASLVLSLNLAKLQGLSPSVAAEVATLATFAATLIAVMNYSRASQESNH